MWNTLNKPLFRYISDDNLVEACGFCPDFREFTWTDSRISGMRIGAVNSAQLGLIRHYGYLQRQNFKVVYRRVGGTEFKAWD